MKIEVEISDEQAKTIQHILDDANASHEFPGTHGELTIEGLVPTLKGSSTQGEKRCQSVTF